MNKIKSYIASLQAFAMREKWVFLGIVFVILTSAFLRLYNISEFMTFLGDEGRDVIVVRRLLVDKDPILVGPGTSIGNMYLGPLYYYMMAIPLFLANYSPVGPAVMVALLGVATTFFVWFVARKWFGEVAGFVASFFYAISPTVIIYSRSSWNPNIMPFFALLFIYSLWKLWHEDAVAWILVTGVSFAFALQSHYLALLLTPVAGVYWLATFVRLRKKKSGVVYKKFIRYSFISLLIFLFLMSPLAIFDARHGWRNVNAMYEFFSKRQTTVSARPWNALPQLPGLLDEIITRLVGARREGVGKWILAILSLPFILIIKNRKKLSKIEISGYTIVIAWIAFALLGLGLYKQEIYDHYYGFFFAAPFILLGGFVGGILSNLKKTGIVLVVLLLSALTYINFANSPIFETPNKQLQRTVAVDEKIKEEAGGEPFNIAVIAERNYEGAYLYFLEKDGAPVVAIDPQREDETVAKQLFVICELEKQKCEPTVSPKAEVANFGWSKIEDEWEVSGVNLFKLIHSQ